MSADLAPLYVKSREPMSHAERGRRGMRARWGEPRHVRLTDLDPALRRVILALVEGDRAVHEKAAPTADQNVGTATVESTSHDSTD